MAKNLAFVRLIAALSTLVSLVLPLPTVTAEASSIPTSLNSWCVGPNWYNTFNNPNNSYGVFYNFGYDIAQSYPSGTVILDFGSLYDPSGTHELDTWEYGPQTFSQVQSEVEQIMQGWEANPNGQNKLVRLVIGTNNSGNGYTTSIQEIMGTQFGTMIKTLLNESPAGLFIEAGDDIETDWSLPEYPLSFCDGYGNSGAGTPMLNFGYVDGNVNPSSSSNNTFGSNQWTPGDVYLASYGKVYNVPGYEVYNSSWPQQYEDFDLWSYNWEGTSWTWPFVLASSSAGGNITNPSTAYTDMQNALNSSPNTATTIQALGNQQAVS